MQKLHLKEKEKAIMKNELALQMFESNMQYIGDAGKRMINEICGRMAKQSFVWNSEPHCVIFSSDSSRLVDYMYILSSELKTIVIVSAIGSADPAVEIKDASGVSIDGSDAMSGKNRLARQAAKDAVAVLGKSADEILSSFVEKISKENGDK